MERVIPLSEAAKTLGLKQPTLRQQIAAGRFAAYKIGRDWVTTPAEVERYAAEQLGKKGRKPKP